MPAVTEIYGHHVLNGFASFETEPPSLDEMTARWQGNVGKGLPYIVRRRRGSGGRIRLCRSLPPPARLPVQRGETRSTWRPDMGRRGIGRRLLENLISACEACGCRQMVAIIGDSGNEGSIALHKRLGFEETGVLKAVGFKRDRWVDTVIMQLTLGDGGSTPPPE